MKFTAYFFFYGYIGLVMLAGSGVHSWVPTLITSYFSIWIQARWTVIREQIY